MSQRSIRDPAIHQIAPVDAGDFVTAFDVIQTQEVIVVGMASGRVLCWKYPSPNQSPQRIGFRTLHKGRWLNDEKGYFHQSVRHIWIDGTRVCAVVGFRDLLVWKDIKSELKVIKFGAELNGFQNTEKFLTYYRNKIRIYGVRNTEEENPTHDAVFYDMQKEMSQKVKARTLNPRYKIMYSDDKHTIVFYRVSTKEEREQFCEVRSLDLKEVYQHIDFPRNEKYYWGFTLCRNYLVYISNHHIIKVQNMADPDEDHEQIKETRMFTHAKTPVLRDRLVGHWKHINAISISDFDELISIGMDHKLRIWKQTPTKFVPTSINLKVPGKFNAGYCYKVYKKGDLVFYSADDGIFMVVL